MDEGDIEEASKKDSVSYLQSYDPFPMETTPGI